MSEDAQQNKPAPVPPALRLLLLASLVLLLVAVGAEWAAHRTPEPQPAPGRGPHDLMIMPGQRVGFITLGLPITQVAETLGKAEIRPQENTQLHIYNQEGLSFAVQKGRILSIFVKTANFATRDGIRVGADVDRVIRTYGDSYEFTGDNEAYVLHYWSAGIHFAVEKTKVVSIQVTEPMLAGGVP